MKKPLLLFLCLCCLGQVSWGQVYLDEMDDGNVSFTGGSPSYTLTEANGELTAMGTSTGAYDAFTYGPNDGAMNITVDATGNNKIYVRAKASNVGTQLRMDILDAAGLATSLPGLTKTLTTEYMVLEYDFTGVYIDGAYGGSTCPVGGPQCPVDGTQVAQLVFFVNPGAGDFNGSIVIDYISFGEEPAAVVMSDVFQDHFDMDSSINALDFFIDGYSLDVNTANSELTITGDGNIGPYDPITYIFRNPTTFDTLDVDATVNNKLYIKVKTTVPGTSLRIDLQDIDEFITTQGSITKILTEEYTVFEYDFAGAYFDLGYGGTPCTAATAPCPVDGSRIANLTFFIDGGSTTGGLLGDVIIDYISFGTSLEPAGAQAELVYEDHFNNETLEFTSDVPGFIGSEAGTAWTIMGDGAGPEFGAVSYGLHDKDTGEPVFVDMTPAQNKLFVKMKIDAGSVPVRIDLIDTAGYATTQASLVKVITDEYTIYEYNFAAAYVDAGYGGTACDVGPCEVDPTAINQLLIYFAPGTQPSFSGSVDIDFISIGQALPDDPGLGPVGMANYQDEMDDNTSLFITNPDGFSSVTANDEWTITGDGSAGAYAALTYTPHNDIGEVILANAQGSANKLYIRAKASADMTQLRVDLQDNQDYMTNLMPPSVNLTTEYQVYELDYAGAYLDGAYGGPCMVSGCPVDGFRVKAIQFFVNPDAGMFNGTVDIDWISFGSAISDVAPGIINYVDEVDETTINFITDVDGLAVTTTAEDIVITGNGTGGDFAAITYKTHDIAGDSIAVDAAGSGNKFYIRAKSTVAGTELRLDLQDNLGYITNLNALTNTIGTEYAVYEYSFGSSLYQDGAYGGSPCMTQGCIVDAMRIQAMQMFVNPGVGEFDGVLSIDWISFGAPLSVGVQNFDKIQTMRAFPNPTTDAVAVEYDLVKSAAIQINVYSLLGERVLENNLGTQTEGLQLETINLEQLPLGMYVVQILADGQSAGTLRLMKK